MMEARVNNCFAKCVLVFAAVQAGLGCGSAEPAPAGAAGTGAQTGPSTTMNTIAGSGAGAPTTTSPTRMDAGTATPPPSTVPSVAGASAGVAGSAGMSSSSGVAGRASAAGMPAVAGSSGMAAMAGATAASAGASGAATMSDAKQALPPITDYAQKGPFKTTTTANVGPGNNYTIFRPDPLGENGFVHSPLIFGPGILTTASLYSTLLLQLASHGFVSICVNSMSGGPNDPGNLDAMKSGLEWLIAQNSEPGVFQNKLAVDRAITMGYSIGATASTQLSSHPAIRTTVSIHGHNTKGDPHGPIWLMTGTMDVIDDNRTTLKTLEEAPAVLTALPIGHLDVPGEISAGGRYIAPITAWLRYWINGDQAAKSYFWGDGCKVCTSPWITPEANDKWKMQQL